MIKTIIFDWKRTLYDPDKSVLIDGCLDLLQFIKSKGIQMILVGKGGDDMEEEIDRLGVRKYFLKTKFEKGEKEIDFFKPFISSNPKNTIFIGDRIRSELENRLWKWGDWSISF